MCIRDSQYGAEVTVVTMGLPKAEEVLREAMAMGCLLYTSAVEEWVRSLSCPIIRVDGVRPIEENINLIIEQIKR